MNETVEIGDLLLGDILLYEGTGLLSRKISEYDKTDYSHSAIYVGNNEVIEAVTGGIQQRTLKESYGDNHSKITVLRLKIPVANMQPVIDVAKAYEQNGNGFAQTQIIMLGLIMITHEHRLTEASAIFIDNILQNAAVELFNFTKRNKEPFICSELVYRSYTEAIAETDDHYIIKITNSSTMPLGQHSDNNESIISKIFNHNSASHPSSFVQRQNIISSSFNGQIIENWEQKIEILSQQINTSNSSELTNETTNQLKENTDRFLSALYFGNKKDSEFIAPDNTNDILDSFFRDNANFVSPGDLYRSDSLKKVGKLNMSEITRE